MLFGGFLSNFPEANYLIPGDCFFSPSAHRRDGDGVLGPSKHFRCVDGKSETTLRLNGFSLGPFFRCIGVSSKSVGNLCGFPCESCPLTGESVASFSRKFSSKKRRHPRSPCFTSFNSSYHRDVVELSMVILVGFDGNFMVI